MRIQHRQFYPALRVVPLALALVFAPPTHATASRSGTDQQARPLAPIAAAASASVAEPIVVDKKLPLALGKGGDAQWRAVPMAWRPVAVLKFESPSESRAGGAPNRNAEPVRTGPLAWRVTPDGTQVTDGRTGLSASIAGLTAREIRPRDMAYSERQGTVWFYGETLFRYQIASRTLERLQPMGEEFHAIRKAVSGPSGLWLATGNGIFLLDDAGAALKKITNAGADGVGFSHAAATDKEAWFATAEARLVRIEAHARGQLGISMSAPLPGAVAELTVSGQQLWLLLSDKHGDYYKLAFVDKGLNQASVLQGKYFSLSEKDGLLAASAYSTSFRIDPGAMTITRIQPAEAGLLARAARKDSVLYAGSSYGYKDGCEVVEHGQIDISKGWINALSDPVFR